MRRLFVMSRYLRAERRSFRRPFQPSLEAIGAFAALLFIVAPAANSQGDIPPVLKIGAKAPAFTLPNPVDGKTYSLKDFDAAKVLVVVFTCNHCPTAELYEDRIKKIAADYRDKGVALVAIQPNGLVG